MRSIAPRGGPPIMVRALSQTDALADGVHLELATGEGRSSDDMNRGTGRFRGEIEYERTNAPDLSARPFASFHEHALSGCNWHRGGLGTEGPLKNSNFRATGRQELKLGVATPNAWREGECPDVANFSVDHVDRWRRYLHEFAGEALIKGRLAIRSGP